MNNYEINYASDDKDILCNLLNEMAKCYLLIYLKTDHMLENYFKDSGQSFNFPIDYVQVASWLGIEVTSDDLNYYRGENFSKILGKLSEIEKGKFCITIEETCSYPMAMYAICHELGHYLFKRGDFNCISANIPNNKREFIADIIACFLMLPPQLTFKYAKGYTDSNKARPVDLDELFHYISSVSDVPYHFVVTGYQHIKLLAFYLNSEANRNMLFADCEKHIKEDDLEHFKALKNNIISKEGIAAKEFFM